MSRKFSRIMNTKKNKITWVTWISAKSTQNKILLTQIDYNFEAALLSIRNSRYHEETTYGCEWKIVLKLCKPQFEFL